MSLYSKIKNYLNPKPPSPEDTFTWKYLDIDSELVEEIRDIYLKNVNINSSGHAFFQVLPLKIPKIMGMEAPFAGLVYSAGNHVPTHSHRDPKAPEASTIALNIPLVNCDNSVTTLYKTNKPPIYTLYGSRIAEIAKISECEIITSYTLNKPLIFNNQTLHAVANYSDQPRFAISLRFRKNPVHWI